MPEIDMPTPRMAGNEMNVLTASGTIDTTVALTEIRLTEGRVVHVPTALLQDAMLDGTFNAAFDEGPIAGPFTASTQGEPMVIPLVEERLDIGKRTVTTGKVRLRKTVHEFEAALDEPLAVRTYDIERVVLNQPVEVAPGVRQEGDTTIYPLVEEQLILTKQLILKEEVRVTRRDTERRDTQVVVLRREHLVVEREPVERE